MNGELNPNFEMLKNPERFFSETEIQSDELKNPQQ